jgi:UDP-N-acetylmuramate--alanine ligase
MQVSGSDLADAPQLDRLRSLGASIFLGHAAAHVGDADLVVVSSAVPDDNSEIVAARRHRIPVIKHSVALGSLMQPRKGIAVAGTHGKSTTTALTAFVLDRAGFDPTFHVGAELIDYGLFGRLGGGAYLVAEADEFDRRFLDYEPEIAVVTSVEPDHLDYFGTFERLVQAYQEFLGRVRPHGVVFLNADDPVARSLSTGPCERVTYGTSAHSDCRLVEWEALNEDQARLAVRVRSGETETFILGIRGQHNALNATAALAVASHLGAPVGAITDALGAFRGTRRRLEVIGKAGGVTVVDDYAHHPTAVRAALGAVRAHWRLLAGGAAALWCIYQPHTEHRTAALFEAFARCFDAADHVILTPAYMPAGRTLSGEGATTVELVAAMSHVDAR